MAIIKQYMSKELPVVKVFEALEAKIRGIIVDYQKVRLTKPKPKPKPKPNPSSSSIQRLISVLFRCKNTIMILK